MNNEIIYLVRKTPSDQEINRCAARRQPNGGYLPWLYSYNEKGTLRQYEEGQWNISSELFEKAIRDKYSATRWEIETSSEVDFLANHFIELI